MSKEIVSDPDILRKKLKRILALDKVQLRHSEIQEAIAEIRFRISIHPQTPPTEAFNHLQKAFKIDGANPKYAYHLGRLFFIYGELEKAGQWLNRAADLCPTSHRIWSHINLLQRELNHCYKSEAYQPDVLKERGEKIAEKIRKGHDVFESELRDLKPPKSEAAKEAEERRGQQSGASKSPSLQDKSEETGQANNRSIMSPVRRTLNPGQCRWSGITDLEIEILLEREPSERTRDKLFPQFDKVIKLSRHRQHGISAFVLLAVEWLTAGYPVATIRRLSEQFPDQSNSEWRSLLKIVCELYEAEENQLPALLASALESKQISPLLAATIHKQRLLWHPWKFDKISSYWSAKKFLQDGTISTEEDEENRRKTDVQIKAHFKNLNGFIKALNPSRPTLIEDKIPIHEHEEPFTAQGAQEIIRELEEKSSDLKTYQKEAFTFLKGKLEADAKNLTDNGSYSQAVANHSALGELILHIQKSAEIGIERLNKLSNQIIALSENELEEDFGSRMEACRNSISEANNLGSFKRVFKRLDKLLKAAEQNHSTQPIAPSEKVEQLLQKVQNVFPEKEETTPNAQHEKTARQEEKASGENEEPIEQKDVSGLEKMIEKVDAKVSRLFASLNATFDPYSPAAKRLRPLQSLYIMTLARQAEVYYRMGKRLDARRIWNALLKDERMNLEILKNIAVCDFYDQDLSRTLSSWRAYCEMLYYYAVVADTPQHKATERAEFHANYASAFAPGFLSAKLDSEWQKKLDEKATISFLRSPARIKSYFDHKLLEFYNRKLDFTSPPLLLGVTRVEGEKARVRAKEKLVEFSDQMSALLSATSHKTFSRICRSFFEKGLENCKNPEGLTLQSDPAYTEEKDRQLHWVADICHLFFKFVAALNASEKVNKAVASFEFLEQLERLEQIPIDLSESFLNSAARTLHTQTYESLMGQVDNLKQHIVYFTLQYIFSEGEDSAGKAARQRQYRRLIDKWIDRPELEKHRDLVDDPQAFYPKTIFEALQDETASNVSAIEELRKWHTRFPEITGPARYLAILLSKQKRPEDLQEAVSVLKETVGIAFSEEGRRECNKLLNQFGTQDSVQRGNYHEALDHLKNMMKEDPANEGWVTHMHNIYSKWIDAEPNQAEQLIAKISQDFDKWLDNTDDDIPEEIKKAALSSKRHLMVQAALARHGKLDQNTNWTQIIKSMDKVLKHDSDNMTAIRFKMISNFQIARPDPRHAKKQIFEAGELAERILKESDDLELRKEANQIKAQIEHVKEALGW